MDIELSNTPSHEPISDIERKQIELSGAAETHIVQ